VVRVSGPDGQQQRQLAGVRILGAEPLITIDLMSLNHVIGRRSNGELSSSPTSSTMRSRRLTQNALGTGLNAPGGDSNAPGTGLNAPGSRRGEQENVLSHGLLIYASHTLQ
jgi:hypothetical protein